MAAAGHPSSEARRRGAPARWVNEDRHGAAPGGRRPLADVSNNEREGKGDAAKDAPPRKARRTDGGDAPTRRHGGEGGDAGGKAREGRRAKEEAVHEAAHQAAAGVHSVSHEGEKARVVAKALLEIEDGTWTHAMPVLAAALEQAHRRLDDATDGELARAEGVLETLRG